MALLHVASIFLSAFLLFLVQPMIAKALLPDFGGSPAVWGTCLVVFQGLLLAGYTWADRARKLAPKWQIAAHGAVLLLPLLLLPPILRTGAPPPTAWPVPALVLALAASVAAPFFALSTNSTLVQHWYAKTVGKEPYFLYAASNLGSLLSLAVYPVFIEPRFGLTEQRWIFTAGYVAFAATSLTLALIASRHAMSVAEAPALQPPPRSATSWKERAHWIWLAAVPSGLLVATTLHVSTDVAAVPLLWVGPLVAYLLSFVLAFAPRKGGGVGIFPRDTLLLVTRLLVAGAILPSGGNATPFVIGLGLAMATLFFGAWLCHGELVSRRPSAEKLGEFYLCMSVGGFVGGFFGNLVAPMLFDRVVEYPLFLAALACVGMSSPRDLLTRSSGIHAAIFAVLVFAPVALDAAGVQVPGVVRGLPLVVLLAATVFQKRHRERFALATAFVAVYGLAELDDNYLSLDSQRSFFGVVRVRQYENLRLMFHGSTSHGYEMLDVDHPIGYYHPDAPITQGVAKAPPGGRIGVIGLGTGAIAEVAKEGQRVDFFEIDPIVEPMAVEWFRYLKKAKAKWSNTIGDARLTLALEKDGSFDVLVLDAFTSDAIPIHLITSDAFELYEKKIAPEGILVAHVSNRHLDVVPVVRSAARKSGLQGRWIAWSPTDEQLESGAAPSTVVILARKPELLESFAWEPLEPGDVIDWTDERSSLLEVISIASD